MDKTKLENKDKDFWMNRVNSRNNDFDRKYRGDFLIEAIEELGKDSDIVLVTDSDLDGHACNILFKEKLGDENVSSIISGHNNYTIDIKDVLKVIENNWNDRPIVFSDLLPDQSEAQRIREFAEDYSEDIVFLDHHDWSEQTINCLKDHVHIINNQDTCATEIVYDWLNMDEDYLEDFVSVVKDADLYIMEDDRTEDLRTLAFRETEKLYDVVREHGANVREDPTVEKILDFYQYREKCEIEMQVKKNTEWIEMRENGWEEYNGIPEEDKVIVALSYGNASRSDVASVLYKGWDDGYEEEFEDEDYNGEGYPGEADIVVVITSGNKVSFRSSKSHDYVNKIAKKLGGGGHPNSAGASVDILSDKEDYEKHVREKGEEVKQVITPLVHEEVEKHIKS